MKTRIAAILPMIAAMYLAGCASVPTAPPQEDAARKQFPLPPADLAGLYIYRNSNFGAALKKRVYVNDEFLGETAPMTYFYQEVAPGNVKLATSSEFGNNDLIVEAEAGKNYFVKQYIKLGVFVGGANLELVSEEEGKKGVLECSLAATPEQ